MAEKKKKLNKGLDAIFGGDITSLIDDIEVGDVITFYINDNTVVTHRVVDKDDDTESFRTKGDANEIEDGGSVAYDKVVGKVVLNVPYLGYILR